MRLKNTRTQSIVAFAKRILFLGISSFNYYKINQNNNFKELELINFAKKKKNKFWSVPCAVHTLICFRFF